MPIDTDAVFKQRPLAGYGAMEDLFNNNNEPETRQTQIESEFIILSGVVENILEELTDIRVKKLNTPYFEDEDNILYEEMNSQTPEITDEQDININDLINDISLTHQLLFKCESTSNPKLPIDKGNSTISPKTLKLYNALTDLLCFVGKYDRLFLS